MASLCLSRSVLSKTYGFNPTSISSSLSPSPSASTLTINNILTSPPAFYSQEQQFHGYSSLRFSVSSPVNVSRGNKSNSPYDNYVFLNPSRVSGPRAATGLVDMIKEKNSENAVVVYSKTWCPYCGQVKGLFKKLGVEAKVIELDQLVEDRDVQDALFDLTGQSTVPNVFIGGKHIGGCDDTVRLHSSGKLIPLLTEAGVVLKDI